MVTPLSLRGGLCCAVFSPQTALCGAGRFWRCLWALGGRSLASFAFPWRRRRGLSRDSSRFGRRRLVGLLIRLSHPSNWLSWELSWELRLNYWRLLRHDWLRRDWLLFILRARGATSSPFYCPLHGRYRDWFAGWN